MSNAIIRVQKDKNNPYVMINKAFLNDDKLSYKAKGLLGYLLSKPDNWKILVIDLIKHGADGKDSVYSGLNELKKFGYIEKSPVRENGKIIHWESVIRETPLPENPQEVENIDSLSLLENPEMGKPEMGKPDIEKPERNNNYINNNIDYNNKSVSQSPQDPELEKLIKIVSSFEDKLRPFLENSVGKLFSTHKEIIQRLHIQHVDDALFKYRITQEQQRIKNPELYFQKCLLSSVQEYGLQEVAI